jgi:uridine kinase
MQNRSRCISPLLFARLAALQATGPRFVIAIDGRGGAGKSSLARLIAESLPGARHCEYDWFHLPQSAIVSSERYDYKRLIHEVLMPFRAGVRDFSVGRYNWGYLSGVEDGFAAERVQLSDVDVIVLEGCGVLHQALTDFYDLSIWLDTNPDESLSRGMRRDVDEYGLDPERVQKAWAEWSAWEEQSLAAYDRRLLADLLLPG